MDLERKYAGTCYIGVVGPESDISICRDSYSAIGKRPGDTGPHHIRATKGYEARQMHLNNFYYDTKHDFILMLDHDMTYQRNTLERLRSHRLPYVSGLYTRRQYPTYPIWFYSGDEWPREPFVEFPDREKLYELGGSGWGCVLLHRDVLTAMLPILKGEMWIIEDDMDIWPYDLAGVMGAIAGLRKLVDEKTITTILRPALAQITETLEQEIKPLRGTGQSSIVGSDIRFPFYAKAAGFPLIGDPQVRCGHVINYPITPDDFEATPEDAMKDLRTKIGEKLLPERKNIKDGLAKLGRVS